MTQTINPTPALTCPDDDAEARAHLESDWHGTVAGGDPLGEHDQAHDTTRPRRPHVHSLSGTRTTRTASALSLCDLAAEALQAERDAEAEREAQDAHHRQRWHAEACTRLAAVAHELVADALGVTEQRTWQPISSTCVETTLDGYRVQVRAEHNVDRVSRPSLWFRLECPNGCTDADLGDYTPWRRIDPTTLALGRKHERRAETLANLGRLLDEVARGVIVCAVCEIEPLCVRCMDREHVDGERCQQCLDRDADEAAIEAAALAAEGRPSLRERLDRIESTDREALAALALEHAREATVTAETPDTGAIVTALNGLALALLDPRPRSRRSLFGRWGGGR